MSDVGTGESKGKRLLERLDKNPFFGFSKPYLNFIGKGSIFSIVYFLMSVVSLIIPFVVIYLAIANRNAMFRNWLTGSVQASAVIAFIFTWFFIAFACWVGFQLWWNRRSQVTSVAESEFVAIPICAGILRTFGEWFGTLIGIIGFGAGLIAVIALRGDAGGILDLLPGFGWASGPLVIFIGPVVGFAYIVVFRLLAELLKVAAALANNTKEIATNLKSK